MLTSDGRSVEVAIVGKEGIVGTPLAVGLNRGPHRAVMQIAGGGVRVKSAVLGDTLRSTPEMRLIWNRYVLIQGLQVAQIAACNRLHDVEERLARWLLMSHERIAGKTLPLTQEFLAQMLGTRRSTVSVAASILQKAGMISYTRGNVTILNKPKLEAAACDCYQIIRQQRNRWQSETS